MGRPEEGKGPIEDAGEGAGAGEVLIGLDDGIDSYSRV